MQSLDHIIMIRRLCRLKTLVAVALLAALTAVGLFHQTHKDSVEREQSMAELPSTPHRILNVTHSIPTSSNGSVINEQLNRQQHSPTVSYIQSPISQLKELTVRQRVTGTTGPIRMALTDIATEQRQQQMTSQDSKRDEVSQLVNPSLSNQTPQLVNPSLSKGYVLAVDYWEQQTSGSRNLQNLQCWAAQYNLSVVEPAMIGSLLRTPLNDHLAGKGFWFRDVFDIDMWNRLSSEKLHSELVAWDKFLSSAPRDVILVSFKHAFPDEIKQRLRKLASSNLPPIAPSQRIKEGCSANWDSARGFLNKNHFHVVREVCFNFAYGDKMSSQQFKSYLYGHLSPASSTVVFKQWRGTGPPARVLIHNAQCGNTRIQEEVGPSQQLLRIAARYQQMFLGGGPYLAVMARMEKVQSYLKKKKKGVPTLAQCFSKLLAAWREIKQQTGLNTTVLAIDMGKYGSNSIHGADKGSELNTKFEEFFRSLYGTELSWDHWENSFESAAHTTDSGYVALLQKVLVVQAKCVVFIGGGSFQKHAQSLYLQAHRTQQCVRIIKECTSARNLYTTT